MRYEKSLFGGHEFYLGRLLIGFNFGCMKRFVVAIKRKTDGMYRAIVQIDI